MHIYKNSYRKCRFTKLVGVSHTHLYTTLNMHIYRLFAEIDADGDKNVTRIEIQQWVERTEAKAHEDQLNAEWEAFNTNEDYEVTWEEYRTGALQSEHNTYHKCTNGQRQINSLQYYV